MCIRDSYDFHGRNRKPQIALAEAFGFADYAQPAGGCCFLTDETYSNKLADLWQARGERNYDLDDIMLLKIGRHIRPASNFKIIVGREEGENRFLAGYRKRFVHLAVASHAGPLALIDGEPTQRDIELAARLLARYSQGRNATTVVVSVTSQDGASHDLEVAPLQPHEVKTSWHVGT